MDAVSSSGDKQVGYSYLRGTRRDLKLNEGTVARKHVTLELDSNGKVGRGEEHGSDRIERRGEGPCSGTDKWERGKERKEK